MKVKSIAECCNTFDLRLAIICLNFFCLFESGCFIQVLLYFCLFLYWYVLDTFVQLYFSSGSNLWISIHRGNIVFALSVIMFVCLLVCLSVCNLFSVKDFSATTWVRILKFGTKLDSNELYCATKNSHLLLISPFICSFFFLSNGYFRHRFLSSYWSQCFKILCTKAKVYCVNGS